MSLFIRPPCGASSQVQVLRKSVNKFFTCPSPTSLYDNTFEFYIEP
jgi:hypothetical protein